MTAGGATAVTILTGACGLLDVIKGEWGESWSEFDQCIRDGLTAMLKAEYEPRRGEAGKLSDLLCPVHANLDAAGSLKPFNNCVACIRNERDELLKKPTNLIAEDDDGN